MTIGKEFSFDSAHRLTGVPPDHKCARLHGHTYRLRVYVSGPPDERGFAGGLDYSEIDAAVKRVLSHVDHYCLNDVDPRCLSNPTTENVCRWLWPRLKAEMPSLSKIVLCESATTWCEYGGQ
jgi:6-pyruvoyltetrahydropterin/6-carboxytetrahydropterin synthase